MTRVAAAGLVLAGVATGAFGASDDGAALPLRKSFSASTALSASARRTGATCGIGRWAPTRSANSASSA